MEEFVYKIWNKEEQCYVAGGLQIKKKSHKVWLKLQYARNAISQSLPLGIKPETENSIRSKYEIHAFKVTFDKKVNQTYGKEIDHK